jgi:hypothetical protein
MLEVIDEVRGAADLIKWFGYWPSFHDAEVLDVELHRSGSSAIRIHTFEITDQVNSQGHYICVKHVVVTFILEGVNNLHLDYFNGQNVIYGLLLRQTPEAYELTLDGCHGVDGTIAAERVQLELAPGVPADSQYLRLAGQ